MLLLGGCACCVYVGCLYKQIHVQLAYDEHSVVCVSRVSE